MTRTAGICVFLLAMLGALAGCGGGGGDGGGTPPAPPTQPVTPPPPDPPIVSGGSLPADVHWQPPAGAVPATGNYVYVASEAGEKVGQGGTWLYTDANASLAWGYANGQFSVDIGDVERQWSAVFALAALREGFHGNAANVGTALPAIQWVLQGRECAQTRGWFVVETLQAQDIELRFKYQCSDSNAVLRGKLRLRRADARQGPITAMPTSLWQPAAGANLPASGSYVYFESSPGEYAGQGQTRLYTPRNATLDIVYFDSIGGVFYQVVAQNGQERFAGNFFGIGEVKLRHGYYPGVQRKPYAVSGIGGMEWGFNKRGCGRVIGWMAVDDVVYFGDYMVHLVMRFEQRCDLSSATLRGKVVISLADVLPPPGPTTPPPSLWGPAPGAVPAAGDYLYLESDAGDSVGGGRTRLYTADNATLLGAPYGSSLHLDVQGDMRWVGEFHTMNSLATLEKGHYPSVGAPPGHDAALGGLAWRADGRACTRLDGWAIVDELTRDANGAVSLIEMRFEQRCEGDAGALRGKLRWTPASAGFGRRVPAPPGLWQPPAGAVPPSGNYIYVESDYADAIGSGDTVLFTHDNAALSVIAVDPARFLYSSLSVGANAGSDSFGVEMGAPAAAGLPQVGAQGNLRGSAPPPAEASVQLSWRSSACPSNNSWYSIDAISYVAGEVDSVEARFGHSCEGTAGALRGKVRWARRDVTPIPGPKAIPAGLWRAPAGVLPTSGSYVYLESAYGDDVGRGRTELLTPATHGFTGGGSTRGLVGFHLNASASPEPWSFFFAPMEGQAAIQVGLYEPAQRHVTGNPTLGSFDISRLGSFCNRVSGWWVVDSVSYDGADLASIELRFEHHCERRSAPLRGHVRWQRP